MELVFCRTSLRTSLVCTQTHLHPQVVYGGVFKNGDDLVNATNVELVKTYLGNSAVNAMWQTARAGQPETGFRPVSWGKGVVVPPATFTRANGDIAVFNYFPTAGTFKVDLAAETKLGVGGKNGKIACVDVWEGTVVALDPTASTAALSLKIEGLGSMLVSCRTTD